MNPAEHNEQLVFENVWGKDVSHVRTQVLNIWKQHGGPIGEKGQDRLRELLFLVKNSAGEVVGMSTAFKAYIKQLRNHFFVFRLMIVPSVRVPGLTSKLLLLTRDFLESVHTEETNDPPIGLLTLVENEELKKFRNEAVWPASKMVYIGNSKGGHHIRVYYFKGVRILP